MIDRTIKGFVSVFIVIACIAWIQPAAAQTAQMNSAAVQYICPMHPDVKSTQPGTCPKCGMTLRGRDESNKPTVAGQQDTKVSLPQIPDTLVYDQEGRRLRFYSDLVKGKTVAINFIFTTCTTICPPLTATFRHLQQGLGERAGRDIQLISVSLDPVTDVPERLKSFAAKFNAGPGWTFVTGNKPDIDVLLKALGAAVADKNDHTPMILIGNDEAHYWARTYGLAPASALLNAVTEASNKSAATRQDASATAPAASPQPNQPPKIKTPAEAAALYFPNLSLLTQDNQPVRFFDDLLKGKTVLINFAFTTCTSVCPAMTANLVKVQEYLGDRVGKDINMITISVDPTVDTPLVLKTYAAKFKVKAGWYFLTGKKADVDQVLHKVGGYVEDKTDHSSVLIIGNIETGEWVKVFAMTKPAEIAAAVTKLAQKPQ